MITAVSRYVVYTPKYNIYIVCSNTEKNDETNDDGEKWRGNRIINVRKTSKEKLTTVE